MANGEEALRAALADPPDLILSDVMMPGLDGFELLKALARACGNGTIPVILLSARAGEESRVEGLDGGADDYLIKPFTARELLARVGAHLAMSAGEAEAEQALTESRATCGAPTRNCAAPMPTWSSSPIRPVTICRNRCARSPFTVSYWKRNSRTEAGWQRARNIWLTASTGRTAWRC